MKIAIEPDAPNVQGSLSRNDCVSGGGTLKD